MGVRSSGFRGERAAIFRWLFVLAAGVLTLASVAWACVSHEDPAAKPDVRVVGASATDVGFVEARKDDNPGTTYRETKTPLRLGSTYIWSAGNLQTATAYDMRVAKRFNSTGGAVGGMNICGNALDWNPSAGLREYRIITNTLPYRAGTVPNDHWAIPPTTWQIPPLGTAGAGAWDICVTPTTRSTTGGAWPSGAQLANIEVTIL